MNITNIQLEELGLLSDTCDNLVHAAKLPFPEAMKLDQSLKGLKDTRDTLRKIYVAIKGVNPWEGQPSGCGSME